MVLIVDYGVGNLASIRNMLKKIGIDAKISATAADVEKATKLILPGVGSFDTCVQKLTESGLVSLLNNKVLEDKTPILGICVGMQLLLQGSEEGVKPGLGWIKGTNVKFNQQILPESVKVPHIGWTDIIQKKSSPLFHEMFDNPRFYFVHSFHPSLSDNSDALVEAFYGYKFVAGVEHENIVGVQFHPEKSHKFGMKLLSNFVTYY